MQCIETPDPPTTSTEPDAPSPASLACDTTSMTLVERPFPGIVNSAGAARDLTERTLDAQHVPQQVRDDALLVVSEMATNAVQHTASGAPRGEFTLQMFLHKGSTTTLTLQVLDQGSTTVPRVGSAEPTSERGRGLYLVKSFSDTWGVIGHHQGVYAQWSWGAPMLLPAWAQGWDLSIKDRCFCAHHPVEDVTFTAPSLQGIRRPVVEISELVRLRTQHPGWKLVYDQRTNGGPQWYTAHRRLHLDEPGHGQVNELFAHSVDRLRELLHGQVAADRRATAHRPAT